MLLHRHEQGQNCCLSGYFGGGEGVSEDSVLYILPDDSHHPGGQRRSVGEKGTEWEGIDGIESVSGPADGRERW